MSALLVVVNNSGESRATWCGSLVTIGRVPPNDIAFQDDSKVSRNHALIRVMGDGRYYLIDLGSANGTSVNGRRVMVPYGLKDEDAIRIGASTLIFRCDPYGEAGKDDQAAGSTLLTVGAAVQRMTIVVVDIRNFTALNETLRPDMLATIMGQFFRDCTESVEKHGGVVDKFIGDAIMARWIVDAGDVKGSVTSALSAVQGMWTIVGNLNKNFAVLSGAFRIGCGINSGQAVLGNVGAGGTREYTALGDSVNIAFRLETASKELNKDIVIGPDSYGVLPKSLWEKSLLTVSVKNKKEPITVWAVAAVELEHILKRL